jgi:hypothetical protein
MNLSEIGTKVGAQLQSLAAAVPAPIGRFASAPGETLKKLVPEKNAIVRPGLAITAATLGAAVIGAWLHARSTTAGLDAIGGGLPGFRERRLFRRRRASARRIAAAIGMVVGGSFVLATMQAALGNKVTKSAAARGATTATAALALDRLFLGRSYLHELQKALGWMGTALTYAAIGTAYALTSPKQEERPDPTGGDISAGVPAM